jgi:hypothetical protein
MVTESAAQTINTLIAHYLPSHQMACLKTSRVASNLFVLSRLSFPSNGYNPSFALALKSDFGPLAAVAVFDFFQSSFFLHQLHTSEH